MTILFCSAVVKNFSSFSLIFLQVKLINSVLAAQQSALEIFTNICNMEGGMFSAALNDLCCGDQYHFMACGLCSLISVLFSFFFFFF